MSEGKAWQDIAEEVGASLAERGLDVVHPFQLGWYNTELQGRAAGLPDLGRERALGILIGNTRSFWPLFRRALERQEDLRSEQDPVDRYTVDAVHSALSVIDVPWLVRFAHDVTSEPLPIQRVARATGLAMLSPSHLSVHATHGPWIALRAVAIVDVEGPGGTAPECPDPCTSCHKPCVEALARALDGTQHAPDARSIERDWGSWVAVRDACPIGRASRYSEDQIGYHYTKLKQLLC